MTRTVQVGDTVLAITPPELPDLGTVTDGASLVGVLAGTGLFSATALRSYITAGMATQASLTAETSARTSADNAEITARVAGDATFRVPLTANTTWYVSSAGSNSNSGLTVGAPWLTLQYAVDTIKARYDGRGFVGTISVASGSYNLGSGLVIDGPFHGFAAINITSPGAVVLTSTGHVVLVQNRADVTISGNFLMGPGAGFANVIAQHRGTCHIGGITISPSVAGSLLVATRFGYIEIDSSIHVATGTSGNLILSSHSGNFRHSNAASIVFDGNHVFSDCTLYSLYGDLTITDSAGFNLSGHTVTGQRFRATAGLIQWALGTPTTIPGSTDGAEQLGGRFVWGTTNNSQWAGTFTYDLSTATGATNVITGVGFLPGTVDFLAAVAATPGVPPSVGMVSTIYNGATSSAGTNYCTSGGSAGGAPLGTSCIGWSTGGGSGVVASVTALSSDGFTLTWAKAGTPTGSLVVYWRARRGV